MNNKVIYCAGPIDLADGKSTINWREELIQVANRMNAESMNKTVVTIFNPASAYKIACPVGAANFDGGRYIEDMNNKAILAANAIIAYVPHDIPSVGTPIEIDLACRHDIPVYIISTIPYGKSIYLTNRVSSDRYVHINEMDITEIDNALLSILTSIVKVTNDEI